MFLNLFIAIILQGFTDTNEKDNKIYTQEMADEFASIWSHFDPGASSFLSIN